MISHKKKSDSVCIYVAGGGMLKYPKPSQAKGLIPLAKETGRNMLLPYFPLAPEHDLIDALNMLYATYKMALEHYPAAKIVLSSLGSALTAEERKRAEALNKTDLIMSTTALDNIFKGMTGRKNLPEECAGERILMGQECIEWIENVW